jgi:hypothetical protein
MWILDITHPYRQVSMACYRESFAFTAFLECLSSKYEYNEEQFNIQNAVNFI